MNNRVLFVSAMALAAVILTAAVSQGQMVLTAAANIAITMAMLKTWRMPDTPLLMKDPVYRNIMYGQMIVSVGGTVLLWAVAIYGDQSSWVTIAAQWLLWGSFGSVALGIVFIRCTEIGRDSLVAMQRIMEDAEAEAKALAEERAAKAAELADLRRPYYNTRGY